MAGQHLLLWRSRQSEGRWEHSDEGTGDQAPTESKMMDVQEGDQGKKGNENRRKLMIFFFVSFFKKND